MRESNKDKSIAEKQKSLKHRCVSKHFWLRSDRVVASEHVTVPKTPSTQHHLTMGWLSSWYPLLLTSELKTILTTPTPHISKNMLPKHAIKWGRMAQKSSEIKGFSQRMWCTNRLLWHTNSDFYGIRTPTFMPYEPFLLGVGVVFNVLMNNLTKQWTSLSHQCSAKKAAHRSLLRASLSPRSPKK